MTIQEEISILRGLQSDHTRFFSKEEFDKLQELLILSHPRPGDKVHYIPFEGCEDSEYENGIVKSISNADNLFVVYHCGGDWKNFQNYTAARTSIKDLKVGWI